MTELNLKCLNKNQIIKYLFYLVMLLAVFIRVIALLNSDNFHGIAAGKVFSAQRLIKHPFELASWIVPAHGPVHLYLVALVLKLFGNPLFAPRLISLFSGIGFVAVYYCFIKQAFDQKIALLSSFVAAFFPLHIIHSVLSTAETCFLFFLACGLLFIERYLKNQQDNNLIYSAILLSLASMCRFEGGLFILFSGFFLIKQPGKLLRFILVASILPMVWMFFNYIYGGNFLFFLCASDSIVRTEFDYLRGLGQSISFKEKLFYWPSQLSDYFGWPVFIVGLWGLVRWGYSRNRRMVFLFFALISFFAFKTVKEELAMQPRYGLSLAILFVPFFGLAVCEFGKMFSFRKKWMLIWGMVFYILIRGTYLTAVFLPRTPLWLIHSGAFLHDNLKADDAVFVDAEEDNYKEPLKLQANTDVDRFIDHNYFFQHQELIDPQERTRLKYVVLISKRRMRNLKLVFKAGDCKIYDITN
ncbi:MAG: glycosyltransferase family 39 protein [Candidatus Omnitrophica bacterium]|nr:glycosyltransferase family 39 protein [Candidatus Omnitrophota bacterium]